MKAMLYYPMALVASVVLFLGCSESKPMLGPEAVIRQADKQLDSARKQFKAGIEKNATSGTYEAGWHLGRACFQRAEFAKDDKERVALAEEGIKACRELVKRKPDSVGGYYYLAMNLGQMARVKKLQALGMVKEMEGHFNRARELDEKFSYAGPDRNLGLLYLRAPRFISVGDKVRALKHLRHAAKLAPEYPANHLNLLEAFIDAEDEKGVAAECATLEILMPAARKKFLGDNWSADWIVWNKRWHELRGKVRDE